MSETMQPEDDIWKGDLLGREAEGAYLRRYIERLYDSDKKDQTSFVLNINSEWGHGKTWFLKNLSKELRKNHPVVYFDAWKNDFSNDALLSFVSVVCSELSKLFWKKKPIAQKIAQVKSVFSSISKNALPILLSVLVKQLTGKGLDDGILSESEKEIFVDASDQLSKVVTSSMIDGFIAQKNAIDDFSCAVQSLVEEINRDAGLKLPICIMVDELDRCRPTYAIELLEAIKHLFSIEGIFFVVATDSVQLAHSIKAVYGNGFNANAYLKRFFFAEYALASPDYFQFSEFLFSQIDVGEKIILPENGISEAKYFAYCSDFFQLSIRDQEQVFSVLKTVLFVSEGEGFHFLFLLLLIFLKHKFIDDYSQLRMHPTLDTLRKLLLEHIRAGRCKDLKIAGFQGGDDAVIPLQYVLNFYMNICQVDIDHRGQYQMVSSNSVFEKMILRSVVNNVFKQSISFYEYFSLVDQAGRLRVR